MLILNLYLGQILEVWLGKNIDSVEISSVLIPLSINTLSIYLINSLKIFFIAENKIILMKKPLMIVFYILILLTVLIYLGFLTIQLYLYCYSFLMFCLMFHLYFKFFIKRSVWTIIKTLSIWGNWYFVPCNELLSSQHQNK